MYLAENRARIAETIPTNTPKRGTVIRHQAGTEWKKLGKEEREHYESLAKARCVEMGLVKLEEGVVAGEGGGDAAMEDGTEDGGDGLQTPDEPMDSEEEIVDDLDDYLYTTGDE